MDESSSKKIDCTKIQDERQKTPIKTLMKQGGGDASPKDKAGFRMNGVRINQPILGREGEAWRV